MSDLLRLAMLHRWGGTWVDMDDIFMRPLPALQNTIGVIEWPNQRGGVAYFGRKFPTLIPPEWIDPGHPLANVGGVQIGNDPMVNWQPGNAFLREWIRAIAFEGTSGKAWGQIVPTNLLVGPQGKSWLSSGVVQLKGQHDLLLHPGYACLNPEACPTTMPCHHAAKVSCSEQGPFFPPHDLRATKAMPNYEALIDEVAFWQVVELTYRHYHSFAAKTKSSHPKALPERRFVGWLGDLAAFDDRLTQMRQLWQKVGNTSVRRPPPPKTSTTRSRRPRSFPPIRGAIHACARFSTRCEANHIRSWVAHQHQVGIEHFHMMLDAASSNLSNPAEKDAYDDMIANPLISVYNTTALGIEGQDASTAHCVETINALATAGKASWIVDLDIDEVFAFGPFATTEDCDGINKTAGFQDRLKEFTSSVPDDTLAILLPRLVFGGNNHVEIPKLTQMRAYTKRGAVASEAGRDPGKMPCPGKYIMRAAGTRHVRWNTKHAV